MKTMKSDFIFVSKLDVNKSSTSEVITKGNGDMETLKRPSIQ
jgi:hypothetical protein